MADGLDVVAVGIEDEGAVVVRVIMRAKARSAVVAAASIHCRAVESVDVGAGGGGEGDMKAAFRLVPLPIQKKGFPCDPKPTPS